MESIEEKKFSRSKLSIVNTVLLLTILSFLLINGSFLSGSKKQAYVVTGELFQTFDYQVELEAEYEEIQKNRMEELELLKTTILNLESKIRTGIADQKELNEYQILSERFIQLEVKVNQELASINAEYSNQVWTKLNTYVEEYALENDYEVIFGASGSGNIMYAQENLNVTEEVITFCNKKYNDQ